MSNKYDELGEKYEFEENARGRWWNFMGRENQVKSSALGNRGERGEDLSCKLFGTGFIKGAQDISNLSESFYIIPKEKGLVL